MAKFGFNFVQAVEDTINRAGIFDQARRKRLEQCRTIEDYDEFYSHKALISMAEKMAERMAERILAAQDASSG